MENNHQIMSLYSKFYAVVYDQPLCEDGTDDVILFDTQEEAKTAIDIEISRVKATSKFIKECREEE